MASKTTLNLLDDLDKITNDFLSELSEMENKRGVPSKKGGDVVQTKQAEKTEPETKAGVDGTDAAPPTDGEEEYRMNHPRRGRCLIFAYSQFKGGMHPPRSCAEDDSKVCKEAFEALKFEVQQFKNLTTKDLKAELEKASVTDHGDCDALAVVYMSHGDTVEGCEKLVTFDGEISSAELWSQLALCPSLLGKPKLFFIQACRGHGVEKGVKVYTDSSSAREKLPIRDGLTFDYPDMLVMLSTYAGMYSFRTERNNIHGSVFIHFLAKVLKENGDKKYLSELLIEVTRLVGEEYEASNIGKNYHEAKQIPQTRSTLTKRTMLTMK